MDNALRIVTGSRSGYFMLLMIFAQGRIRSKVSYNLNKLD